VTGIKTKISPEFNNPDNSEVSISTINKSFGQKIKLKDSSKLKFKIKEIKSDGSNVSSE